MAVTTTAIMREHLKAITSQARQIALLEEKAARYEKLAAEWEQRALAAEGKLADQVNWEQAAAHNYEAYMTAERKSGYLRALLERLCDAHTTEELASARKAAYHHLYNGGEEAREEVSSNGRYEGAHRSIE